MKTAAFKAFKPKNHYGFDHKKSTKEKSKEQSLTVPGMEITPARALEKYQRGDEIGTLTGVYTDNYGIEVPEFEKMTRLEKLEWAAENRPRLMEENERLKKIVEDQRKAEEEEAKGNKDEDDTPVPSDPA